VAHAIEATGLEREFKGGIKAVVGVLNFGSKAYDLTQAKPGSMGGTLTSLTFYSGLTPTKS